MASADCTNRSGIKSSVKRSGRNCTASAAAVMPNIAIEIETKAEIVPGNYAQQTGQHDFIHQGAGAQKKQTKKEESHRTHSTRACQ